MKSALSYKYILSVAFPIMVGMFVQFTVIITDGAFLNRVGNIEFNANGNAGMLYVSLFMFAMGISNGAQVLIARRDGENNKKEAGKVFQQSLIILLTLSVLFTAILILGAHFLLAQFVSHQATSNLMIDYLDIRAWGMIFSMAILAFQGFYSGIARTRVIMYYTVITAVLNIILDYIMVFGKFGCPAMGLEGAALATLISEIAAFVFVIIYTFNDKFIKQYELFKNFVYDSVIIKSLLSLSWPLMLQGFVSTGTWTVFFFFIEQLGVHELEISQIIRMFYLVALIPVLGLGSATRTFVSHLIAEKRVDDVIPTVKRIILMNVIFTFILTAPNLFFPTYAVPVISTNGIILNDAAFTLQIVTGAMFLLAISMPLLNLIAGAGDSKTAFKIELIAISIYLLGAYLVTVKFPQTITVVWCLEYVYFSLMLFAAMYYIRKGKWKTIQI